MVQRQQADGSAAAAKSAPTRHDRLGHWMRVAVMFLSFGMIYPNALVEDMDPSKYDSDSEAKAKKK